MSHIGNKIISYPKNFEINFNNKILNIKGNNGFKNLTIKGNLNLEINKINFTIKIIALDKFNTTKAFHGLYRSIIQNIILGLEIKYFKILYLEGVGYKFFLNKNNLMLNLGFCDIKNLIIPENIEVKLESPLKLIISGIDKESVTLFASKIRNFRPPEIYKGKGVLYEGEIIKKKTKKAKK